ncbi:hypothetical protein CTRI78_v001002 [Colletotrichum trifolii]|uniref:Uncharacterized protein n=1 Tax=Colletotrichum trifolii TaxID=5466 RepID=A0A4R8RV07_COLTR|nr:hypothetical protein CTRI78_v001002 [Colletotrichum trifolii]
MAGTIHSFGSRSSRSLFVWLLFQVILIGASPTPVQPAAAPDTDAIQARQVREKWPKFDQDYAGRVKKGQYFTELLPLDEEQAKTYNGGESVASPFRDPASLFTWGWTPHIFWSPYKTEDGRIGVTPDFGAKLDPAFRDEEFPLDKNQNGVYYIAHDTKFKKPDGTEGQPTEGFYSNVVNPAARTFIFDSNMSPTYHKQMYGKGDVPEMDTLSDFALYAWRDACFVKGVDPKELKVVFRTGVSYGPAFKTVMEALEKAGHTQVPRWEERIVLPMTEDPGRAVLGTLHGAGVAWMLIQHKDIFGKKKIKEVAVFGQFPFDLKQVSTEVFLNLRFTIEDA